MRAINLLTCGAALTFVALPAYADVFAVTTKGDHAIKGKIELSGTAFAVTPDLLLTASRVVGSPEDFKELAVAGQSGHSSRKMTVRSLTENSDRAVEVIMGERAVDDQVVILTPDAPHPPMTAERLSACALVDGEVYTIAAGSSAQDIIGNLTFSLAGQVSRFSRGPGWDPKRILGAPMLGSDGRVVGLVTNAAPDGSAVGFKPIVDFLQRLPQDVEVACDPRVDPRVLVDLERNVRGLSDRVRIAEENARSLKRRVEVAEQTGNFAVAVLADVASDLEKINAARASNDDIGPLLDNMKTRLQSLQLTPTVRTINALLRRPDWTATAKALEDNLILTFTYRTQLPGPGFSNSLRLCMRAIKPYKGSEGDHDFRTLKFYSDATTDTTEAVKCATTNVNIPAGRQDMGHYVFEVSRADMTNMFERYREARDWLPADYVWSGLTYAVLIKPGAPSEQGEGQPDDVIMHMLIIPPNKSLPGAAAVQCKMFEQEQAVIDFLALSDWASDAIAFDDVKGVVLDPENKSDECVSAFMH